MRRDPAWKGQRWIKQAQFDHSRIFRTRVTGRGSNNQARPLRLPSLKRGSNMKSITNMISVQVIVMTMVIITGGAAYAQYWATDGNDIGAGDFLGGNENISYDRPLIIVVDGETAMRLIPNSDDYTPSVVGGHEDNDIYSGVFGASICGGGISDWGNSVTDSYGFIGGGRGNQAGDGTGTTTDRLAATVGGGSDNTASGSHSTVCGGQLNQATDFGSSVVGGLFNSAEGYLSIAGGGYDNSAIDDYSSLVGGYRNSMDGTYSVLVGGYYNSTSNNISTLVGGMYNEAGYSASVVGGMYNDATGNYSTVGGGYNNDASGYYSTIPGGYDNSAAGDYSFAAGRFANATLNGCFIWGDSQSSSVSCPTNNTFNIRAYYGLYLGRSSLPSYSSYRLINTSTGAYLSTSGVWTNAPSTAEYKINVEPANDEAILELLRQISINEWTHIEDAPYVRHIGPMADDFHYSFGLGDGPDGIAASDMAGVAMAAIQALDRKVQDRDVLIAGLQKQVEKLHDLDKELDARLAQITSLEERLEGFEKTQESKALNRAAIPDMAGAGLFILGLLLAGLIAVGSRKWK
jgi:hypothetical protein